MKVVYCLLIWKRNLMLKSFKSVKVLISFHILRLFLNSETIFHQFKYVQEVLHRNVNVQYNFI